jgi:hypothetical protein
MERDFLRTAKKLGLLKQDKPSPPSEQEAVQP